MPLVLKRSQRPASAACVLFVLLGASCSSGAKRGAGDAASPSTSNLVAQVAGYDIAIGRQRFIVGLLTRDQNLVGHGTVSLRFGYLGQEREGTAALGRPVTARFLAIPGEAGGLPPPPKKQPEVVRSSGLRGVYAATASFDRPGFWGVQVTARLKGRGPQAAQAAFEVLPQHRVPWVGEDAPRTQNHTLASAGVPKEAIDSRAAEGAEVPDPDLHQMTVAQAIEQKRPVLLNISTPVYCVSRFCGPITDMVSGLAKKYPDRAAYIHIEVWRDFQNKQINQAAAEWILRNENAQEPWVFLIGADGKIAARWDNVATAAEIEPLLQKLPVLS